MAVHRLAWIALLSLIILVIAGATVRVTGSGLGCPDWPTCWGCLIPPTRADQIDVNKLDLEKFKKHASRKGIDPDSITRENVLDSFDPVHTWIEFSNRLATMPLGLATLLLVGFSFFAKQNKPWIVGLALFSLIDVIVNAIMGAIVVRTGLQPGVITVHMALAFLLIAVLVSIIWLSRPNRIVNPAPASSNRKLKVVSMIFFAFLFGEGLMGSRLREQTDEFAIKADTREGIEREKWGAELAKTFAYKFHRSFSWSLLLVSGLIFFWTNQELKDSKFGEPKLIFFMVVAMMLMGIILGHIAVHPVIQVLHVGMTAVLLAVTWHWIMRLWAIETVAMRQG